MKIIHFTRCAVKALPAVMLVILLASCAARVDRGPVDDLLTLPQDLGAYLDPATSDLAIYNETQRQEMSLEYIEKFFSPWDRDTSSYSRDDLFWGFAKYEKRTTWGEHYRARGPWWVNALALNADPGDYPNTNRPAITTAHTSMRVLPTIEPIFADPTQPGEGFPFDYNQNSLVWAGTPLFVIQTSADGAWLLCENRFAGGWIQARDVAFVDEAFMTRYRSGSFTAIIDDRVPLKEDGLFRFQGRLGMMLPRLAESTVGVPLRGPRGMAQLGSATLPDGAGVHFPLVATRGNIAALGNRMMGQPYGWGGLYEHRDCSATLMDLFAPFGIALPRNSKAQAKTGDVTTISGLSARQKKETLLSMPPFTTLVGKRGHIMLYVGQHRGEPVIYHTVWGIRTTSTGPLPGRHIIGQTVVTTLQPGKELRNLGTKAMLIDTISSYSNLEALTVK